MNKLEIVSIYPNIHSSDTIDVSVSIPCDIRPDINAVLYHATEAVRNNWSAIELRKTKKTDEKNNLKNYGGLTLVRHTRRVFMEWYR